MIPLPSPSAASLCTSSKTSQSSGEAARYCAEWDGATTTCSSSFRRRRRRPPFFPLLLVMIFPRMRPPPPLPARPRTKGGEIALKSETQYLSPMSNSYIVSERASERTSGRREERAAARRRRTEGSVDSPPSVPTAKESRSGIISRSARPMGKNICLA